MAKTKEQAVSGAAAIYAHWLSTQSIGQLIEHIEQMDEAA